MINFPKNGDAALLPVLDLLLADQQQLTAVERFSQRHASDSRPAMAETYRDLIPPTAVAVVTSPPLVAVEPAGDSPVGAPPVEPTPTGEPP